MISRALAALLLTWVLALVASACSSGSSSGASGCAIGGNKCTYGCTANLGCTNCVSNADCKDGGKPACVLGQCRECGPGAACGAAQACFPRDSQCQTRCAADSDCPGDAPICLTDSGACVGCQVAADCAASPGKPICDPTRAQCSECGAVADCGAAAPVCDLSDGTCRECLVDTDCRFPEACGVDRKCHHSCASNADCGDAKNPFCDVPSGECVACLVSANCGAAAPICNDRKCVECGVDLDCHAPTTPFCQGDHCVACVTDQDCTDPAAAICKGDVCIGCDKDKDCKDPALPSCVAQRCVAP